MKVQSEWLKSYSTAPSATHKKEITIFSGVLVPLLVKWKLLRYCKGCWSFKRSVIHSLYIYIFMKTYITRKNTGIFAVIWVGRDTIYIKSILTTHQKEWKCWKLQYYLTADWNEMSDTMHSIELVWGVELGMGVGVGIKSTAFSSACSCTESASRPLSSIVDMALLYIQFNSSIPAKRLSQ